MIKNRFEILFNILFWIVSSWLVVSLFSIEVQEVEVVNGREIETFTRSISLIKIFFIGQVLFALHFYFQLYLILQLNKKNQLKEVLLRSLFLFVAVILLFFILIKILSPNNTFAYFIPSVSYIILIFYLAVAFSYGFIKIWFKNVRDKKQLELVKNQAELNLLKSQLQPHFFFNTLNNLLSMVDQKNNPKLATSIDKLSALLRYVVYDMKETKVAIEKEIEFIKSFVDLNRLRFTEDEIDFRFNIIGNHNQQKIEPGIFICYVENAFKHGAQPEEKSFINMQLDISKKDRIFFSIENPILPSLNTKEGGYGVEANNERLKLAYPNKHFIKITNDDIFKVELTLQTV